MPTTLSDILVTAGLHARPSDTVEGVSLSALVAVETKHQWTHGSGANQVNALALDRDRVLSTTGAFLDFDLATLAGFQLTVDLLRNPVTMDAVRAVSVRNHATSVGSLLVGGAAANPWLAPFNGSGTARLVVPPGGTLLLTAPQGAGMLLSPSTKMLRCEASGGAVTFDLVVLGVDT